MVSIRLEGGLANQMTMLAFILSYSKKHNLEYAVSTKVNNPHIAGQPAYRFPGINYSDNIPNLPVYIEKHFHYEEIPYMDNVCFHGFFQSWKYFDDYKDDVLKAFGFQWEIKKNYCSSHIRRGDYIKWADYHPPVTEKYLRNAIEYIYFNVGEKVKFKFYSDDMPWCKEFGSKTFSQHPDMVEYSEGKNEMEDLEDASCCAYSIGSNSMYSFWINYLNQNPNKIFTFPKKWFGEALNHNTMDLYLPNSIII